MVQAFNNQQLELIIHNRTKNNILNEWFTDIWLIFNTCIQHLKITKLSSISLVIVKKRSMQTLNNKYNVATKHQQHADVLSFPAQIETADNINQLGDIFISVDKVITQSLAYHHSIRREFCFLFLHGLLHLLGYDHQINAEEVIMFQIQTNILKQLNINRH